MQSSRRYLATLLPIATLAAVATGCSSDSSGDGLAFEPVLVSSALLSEDGGSCPGQSGDMRCAELGAVGSICQDGEELCCFEAPGGTALCVPDALPLDAEIMSIEVDDDLAGSDDDGSSKAWAGSVGLVGGGSLGMESCREYGWVCRLEDCIPPQHRDDIFRCNVVCEWVCRRHF